MSFPLIVDGNSYQYPSQGDKANTGWGSQTGGWASAVTLALTKLGLGGTLSPLANAVIDISSTSKGILIPRMTTAQRNAITSPENSLLIFNTDLKVVQYYDLSVTQWISVGAKLPDNVVFSGTLTVNGNITGLGSITATSGLNGATGNFTDTTDATDADNAPLKTLGGMAVKKKLFVGTDLGVGGDANVTGKALTGNGLVGAPTHSFISDPDSGLYRISENKIGFAANGIRQGEFGVGYGGFIGNVIQWITDKTQTPKSNTARAYVDIEKGTGVSWEILLTPKLLNSKIVILFRGAFQISSSASITGVRVLNKVNLGGTYSAIWKPEEINTTAPFDPVDVGSGTTTAMYKNDYFVHAYHNPTYLIGDVLYYKFQFSPYNAGNVTNNSSRAGNNGETSVSIMEIAQ